MSWLSVYIDISSGFVIHKLLKTIKKQSCVYPSDKAFYDIYNR